MILIICFLGARIKAEPLLLYTQTGHDLNLRFLSAKTQPDSNGVIYAWCRTLGLHRGLMIHLCVWMLAHNPPSLILLFGRKGLYRLKFTHSKHQ